MDNYKEPSEEESVDVKKLIFKFLSKWYFFAISLVVSLVFAYLYNKLSPKEYEVETSILVKDEQTVLDSKFSAGLGIYNTQFRISNETGILKSFQITRRTLERLNFGIDYFSENRFSETELYNESPFEVLMDSTVSQPVNVKFYVILLSNKEFKLTINEEDVAQYNFKLKRKAGKYQELTYSKTHRFFEKIQTRDFAFTIVPRYVPEETHHFEKLSFRLNTPDVLVKRYRSFTVSSEKNSSIITLSLKGNNVNKLTDFLNTLVSEYLKKGIEKKNLIAENTIKFIDTQVGEIADSLVYSEQKLQNYRSENSVMNMDFQAQQAMTGLENYKNQRAEIMVKARYYEYLKNYLKENKDGQDLVAPSALGIDDPILSNLLNELTRMFNDRLEMMFNSKKDNPYLSSLDMRINSMKKSILENIESLIDATEISLQDIDERIAQISERVNKLPETQRQLFGFERKFKLNDAIYTYLLTKRSEMQIAKASYLPDNEIIDNANDADAILVAPNDNRNFIIAFLLGLGLPLAFLLLKDYLNNKILLVEDIENITDFPILGHILRHKEKSRSVVFENPKCLTSESFRGVRANFQFIANESNKNVIMVTSSTMSEGKSFITINLAQSFALNNKKCVILSFDLRKPKVSEYLSVKKDKGISSFLSSEISLDDIIIPEVFPNLDIILSGPIPPNPMELISGYRTKEFFSLLKERYDYIFVDTPPIGMVADALLLLKYSDVNIYITRYNYTNKNMVANILQNLRKRGISNLNILINDVPVRRKLLSYSNNFDYGYGYNYYYSDDKKSGTTDSNKKKNIFRVLMSKTGLW